MGIGVELLLWAVMSLGGTRAQADPAQSPPGPAELGDDNRFYPALYYPGAVDSALAGTIELQPGESSSDLLLSLESAGGTITGRVLGTTSTNRKGASLAFPLTGVLVVATVDGFKVMTRTRADGAFTLAGVPAGSAIVRYATDDPLSREVHYLAEYHPGEFAPSRAERIEVKNGQVATLDAVMLPPAAVVGGLVRASDTNLPVPKVKVVIQSRLTSGSSWTVLTNAEGRFLHGGMPAGEYVVQANPPGAEYIPEYYGGERDLSTAAAIPLQEGEPFLDAEILLDRGGSISGSLRREDETSIEEAAILATDLRTGAQYSGISHRFGAYRISGLPSGEYRLFCPLLRRYWIDTPDPKQARAVRVTEPDEVFNVNFTGSSQEGCPIVESQQGVITGQIRGDFAAASRVVIRAFSKGDTAEQQIDFPGDYTIACLRPGLYKVALLTDGPMAAQYYPQKRLLSEAQPIAVAAGDTARGIDFSPHDGVKLQGQILERASGQPLRGIGIQAIELDDRINVSTLTDSLGRFVLDRVVYDHSPGIASGLPSGRWRVWAESTCVPAPALTPVLQPRLEANPAPSGRVEIVCGLPAGTRWCFLLERTEEDSLTSAGGIPVFHGERGASDPESNEVVLDVPPGPGPYRYRLQAWTSTQSCQGGQPAGESVYTVWSGPVSPGPPLAPAVAGAADVAVRAFPVPWTGKGNFSVRSSRALQRNVQLKIFSPAGVEVASCDWPEGQDQVSFLGKDRAGRALPSGFFQWSVRQGGRTLGHGTLLLIR